MVDLTINDEMKDILSSMKGRLLKFIEGDYRFGSKEFTEFVRLNLGRYSVEIYVDYTLIKWPLGGDHPIEEEENCFVIRKTDSEHTYLKGWNPVRFLKDERISEVILVRDTIKTNRGEEIVSDTGIVIRTGETVYSFSRWGLGIYFNEGSRINLFWTLKDVKKEFTDDYNGVIPLRITRDYIFL